jgi:hypothetical protein
MFGRDDIVKHVQGVEIAMQLQSSPQARSECGFVRILVFIRFE